MNVLGACELFSRSSIDVTRYRLRLDDMSKNKPSRHVETAALVDRPEPYRDELKTPEDKVYKARCILLDVVSRNHRGLPVKGDWENRNCLQDVILLLAEVLVETDG